MLNYLQDCGSVLNRRHRTTIAYIASCRTITYGLDLGAIFLLVSGIDDLTKRLTSSAVTMLGLATTMMLLRSILTLLISRSTFNFLALVEIEVGGDFTRQVFSSSMEVLDRFRIPEVSFALNQGINSMTTRTVGFLLILISDGLALVSLVVVFSVLYPIEGGMLIALVLLFLVPIQKHVSRRVRDSSAKWADATINMLHEINEYQSLRREVFLNSASTLVAARLQKLRENSAHSSARFNYLLTIPRSVIEFSTLVISGVLLAFGYSHMSSEDFIIFTAILVAIVFRVAPLTIGIIGALGVITQSEGESGTSRSLLQTAVGCSSPTSTTSLIIWGEGQDPVVLMRDVSYTFSTSRHTVLHGVNLEINQGEVCAIVGPSGSGKTTLLECLVGLREVDCGSVVLFGMTPAELRNQHHGSVGLLSQSPSLRSASIAENVALFSHEDMDLNRVNNLIDHVGLSDLVRRLPDGLHSLVGDGFIQLSGGEKQRLAFARALYSDPRLLVLDEPTSALDGLSEEHIFELIMREKEHRTIILVTHRQPHNDLISRIYSVRNGEVVPKRLNH